MSSLSADAAKVNSLVQAGKFEPLAPEFTYNVESGNWHGSIRAPITTAAIARTKQQVRAIIIAAVAQAFPDPVQVNVPLTQFLKETQHTVDVKMSVTMDGYSGIIKTKCSVCECNSTFSLPDSGKLSKEIKTAIMRTCPRFN